MNITKANSIDTTNEVFLDFIVNNVIFAYDETKNPIVSEYLCTKLDDVKLKNSKKVILKK